MKKILGSLSLLFFVIGCATTPVQTSPDKSEATKKTPPVTEEKKDAGEIKNSDIAAEKGDGDEEPITRYSDVSNMAPPSDRNYKRMTRQKMEDDSELYGSAGSLWKMEGQTSFLFAENKHRREGDPTSIKMEGPALKTIENKVSVIVDLLKQLDEQRKKAEDDAKKAEADKVRLAQIEEEKKLRAEQIAKGEIVVDPYADQYPAEADRKPAATDPVVAAKPEKEEKIDLKEVEFIPSKIVEKMSDGIYRIQGQQFLTIKKKPYKVIATALIRAEDFSDSNISSMKLMDAQYDVIHVKRTAQ